MAVIFAWYVISYTYYKFAFIGDVKAIERHIASLVGRVPIARRAAAAVAAARAYGSAHDYAYGNSCSNAGHPVPVAPIAAPVLPSSASKTLQ